MKAFQRKVRGPWFWAGLLILSLAAPCYFWLFSCPWDYDPKKLLDNTSHNPEFVKRARATLRRASRAGLRPRLTYVYRSPEESEYLNSQYKKGEGPRAAAAWQSCHNYGLAFDMLMFDEEGKVLANKRKGWYQLYQDFAKIAEKNNLMWGDTFTGGDAGHFEYHPAWHSGANGNFLLSARKWALKAAGEKGRPNLVATNLPPPKWLEYFWWAAGAGGQEPPAEYLAENPVPVEPVRVAMVYAHEDDLLRYGFSSTLKRLQRNGIIVDWIERKLMPGDNWQGVVDRNVQKAEFVLFLVSSNFLASDYGNKSEMQVIMDRQKAGQARVLPIVVSSCEWNKTPYGTLQGLPRTGKPATDYSKCEDAWADIARDIKGELRSFRGYK